MKPIVYNLVFFEASTFLHRQDFPVQRYVQPEQGHFLHLL
jgi:hypothetical protein